ncbi:MAG: DUF1858 domain-containing protein [Eubacteriales bacterium]|nr:DUF1858 domain-containing protein [Eubacteriales bacterium]MDD3200097.1 DUF1858 domain-containing protein [Eubacteriales bacterium]MDD4121809.1 DUF1858 domain-containing protein [Eubacteriales bacterium]MDD4630341.1 DUF1858 domain-containing protein [Eubacteriales bacterium]
MKINENMLINDMLDKYPELTDILFRHGLNCLGCPGASNEILREAAEGHGISIEKLVEDLNQFLADK